MKIRQKLKKKPYRQKGIEDEKKHEKKKKDKQTKIKRIDKTQQIKDKVKGREKN